METVLPLLVKFGIPLACYAVGHLVGFLHHASKSRTAQPASGSQQKPNGQIDILLDYANLGAALDASIAKAIVVRNSQGKERR